ncbi:hypothetical protein VPH35_047532 [Triticum aestivum]
MLEDGDDLISKLPDEVLVSIVMSVDSFKPKHHRRPRPELRHEYADRANAAMIEAARANAAMIGAARANAAMIGAARNKTRSLYAIDVLRLEFYLGDHSVSIGRAVADAMPTHKVALAVFTILTPKEIWQCSNSDLLAYGRQLRSFVGACRSAFGGIARLKLQNLRLPDDGLPKILSTPGSSASGAGSFM